MTFKRKEKFIKLSRRFTGKSGINVISFILSYPVKKKGRKQTLSELEIQPQTHRGGRNKNRRTRIIECVE